MEQHTVFQPVSGLRAASLAALLGLALLLMAVPAVVAAISFADAALVSGAWAAVHGTSAWLAFLAPVHVLLFLPLAAMVSREREDS